LIMLIACVRLLNTRMTIVLNFNLIFVTGIEPHAYLHITTLAIGHSNTTKFS
jgi:hypothetical protein